MGERRRNAERERYKDTPNTKGCSVTLNDEDEGTEEMDKNLSKKERYLLAIH